MLTNKSSSFHSFWLVHSFCRVALVTTVNSQAVRESLKPGKTHIFLTCCSEHCENCGIRSSLFIFASQPIKFYVLWFPIMACFIPESFCPQITCVHWGDRTPRIWPNLHIDRCLKHSLIKLALHNMWLLTLLKEWEINVNAQVWTICAL